MRVPDTCLYDRLASHFSHCTALVSDIKADITLCKSIELWWTSAMALKNYTIFYLVEYNLIRALQCWHWLECQNYNEWSAVAWNYSSVRMLSANRNTRDRSFSSFLNRCWESPSIVSLVIASILYNLNDFLYQLHIVLLPQNLTWHSMDCHGRL